MIEGGPDQRFVAECLGRYEALQARFAIVFALAKRRPLI
jgi:hypothetical protein